MVRGRVDEFTTYLAVDLADGADAADFDAAVTELLPADQEHQGLSLDQRSQAARGTISAVASGLAVFALVAAAATIVAVGQVVGRHISGARSDSEVLNALGVTALGRVEALVWLAVPVAIAGAVLAGVGAWLASPIMPMGLARRAEPDPGLAVDWIALVGGGLAIILTVLVAAAVAGWLTIRNRGSHRREPSALAEVLGRAGAGPVTTNGARLAVDRRAPALAARSALAGVTVAILGVVAVITFSASLDRLVETPERWGYRWDLLLNFTSDEVAAGAARLSEDERISAAARWDAGFSYVEGFRVRAYGLRPLIGDIGFALRSGRQPHSPGEVVLGTDLAERLRVGVGDRIEVAPMPDTTDTAPVVVVGTSLFPDDGDGGFTGAIGYFDAAFADHATAAHLFEASQVVVRLRPGIDVDTATAALAVDYPESVSGESVPIAPHEVSNLGSVRSLPLWLAGCLAALGTVSLLHVLITTLRRRPGELATLRALGITPRQTGACILWQSLIITAIGLAAGLPLGLIVGDAAWFVITDPTGLASDADRPLVLYATVGVLAVLISIIVAVAPGRRAGRLRLVDALRTG